MVGVRRSLAQENMQEASDLSVIGMESDGRPSPTLLFLLRVFAVKPIT